MNDEQRKQIIEGLNAVAREMEHWKFREDVDRLAVENMRARVLEGVRADVDAFVKGAAQFDDLTMLCVAYLGDDGAETIVQGDGIP